MNTVGALKNSTGTLITDEENIRKHAAEYIQGLFLDNEGGTVQLTIVSVSFPRLNEESRQRLSQSFSEEGIVSSYKSYGALEGSWPGWPACSFLQSPL